MYAEGVHARLLRRAKLVEAARWHFGDSAVRGQSPAASRRVSTIVRVRQAVGGVVIGVGERLLPRNDAMTATLPDRRLGA